MGGNRGHKVQHGRAGKSKKPLDARLSIQIARRSNSNNSGGGTFTGRKHSKQPQHQHQQKNRGSPKVAGNAGRKEISIVGHYRGQDGHGGLAIAGSSRTAAEPAYADAPRSRGICISGRASASGEQQQQREAEYVERRGYGYHGDSTRNGEEEEEYVGGRQHYTSGRRRQGRKGGVFAQCLEQVVGQAVSVSSSSAAAAAGGEGLAVFLHGLGRYMSATADTISRASGGSQGESSDRLTRRTIPSSVSNGISIAGTSKGA